MNIVAYNPSTDGLEKSYLNKSIASAVSALPVKNADRFVAGQKLLIGSMSRERSEIVTATGTITSTSIPISGSTKFPHNSDDPVFALDYDKVRFYRSTTGPNGSYSVLADVDIDVDNSDDKTYYNDVNALTTYYYTMCYYDSVTSEESDRTDPIPATGYLRKAVGTLLTAVAKDVGDPEFAEFSIDQYLGWMNDINDDLVKRAKRPYRFLGTHKSIDILLGDSTIPLPADLWKTDYIEVNDNIGAASDTFQPKEVSLTQARNRLKISTLKADRVDGLALDGKALEYVFFPAARTDRIGAFTLYYYKFFNEFKSLSDLVETPDTLIYKQGLKREVYLVKADSDSKYYNKAMDADKRYNSEVLNMNREKNISAAGTTGMGPDRKKYPQFGGSRYRQ